MAANKLNNNEINENSENNKQDSSINSLKNFCAKYKKFIATGAMLVLLAVVIASTRSSSTGKGGSASGTTGKANSGGSETEVEEFKIDEYPQVNALFEEYYDYYAKGDTDSLEKIAYPVSDTEKSYIKLFSQYVDSYEDIKCYTKTGMTEDEFIVSVAFGLKFKDIQTAAPELEYFYVRKDGSGTYYIDNAYSQFNQSNQENTTDEGINTLMTEYEQEEDVVALQKQIQKDYDKAMSSDADLEKMVKDTVQDVISDWVASFSSVTDNENPVKKPGDQSDEPDTSVTERIAYTSTEVNLRKKRSTSSDVVRLLKKGTEVTVYGESKDGWYKVKANGDTGFVSDEYIVSEKPGSDKGKNDNNTNSNSEEKERTAYAKTKVNLRKKRSTSSDIIKTLKAGAEVTVYGESKNGWYKVKADGDMGFVSDEYIVWDKSKVEKNKKDEKSNTEEQTRTAYAKTKVNLRKKRSTSSKVLKTLKAGTEVTVYGKSTNGWYKVKAKGKTGYIKDDYIVSDQSKVEKNSTGSQQPSTPAGPSYYNEGDRITLSDSVNVRASMSESADRVGLAYKGDVVTVIMSYAEGWTKVSWNGQTGYIKTEYLR